MKLAVRGPHGQVLVRGVEKSAILGTGKNKNPQPRRGWMNRAVSMEQL
jgi:hypothetical protein